MPERLQKLTCIEEKIKARRLIQQQIVDFFKYFQHCFKCAPDRKAIFHATMPLARRKKMFDTDYPLTQTQIESYRKNGFVQIDDVVTGEHLKRIRDAVTAAVQKEVIDDRRSFYEKSSYEQIFIQKINLWDRHPELKEFSLSRRFAQHRCAAVRLPGADFLPTTRCTRSRAPAPRRRGIRIHTTGRISKRGPAAQSLAGTVERDMARSPVAFRFCRELKFITTFRPPI